MFLILAGRDTVKIETTFNEGLITLANTTQPCYIFFFLPFQHLFMDKTNPLFPMPLTSFGKCLGYLKSILVVDSVLSFIIMLGLIMMRSCN
ncbi:hypothetical protein AQUCO_01400897v1 [Aquilegia coerulea]|uniref:Uncharacterized protein n=1 Tax=Aquilegia coerulea TaxID=218851 RepID=A0A2G5DYM4_AQUCA|nr:hypothetical protein AQUCO_01400897v1 [Aquilegia coerulea]